jgi:hypothetical protein
MKMEAVCFSETSLNFSQAIWHHNPKDNALKICFGKVGTEYD